jgi:hypothetical protein
MQTVANVGLTHAHSSGKCKTKDIVYTSTTYIYIYIYIHIQSADIHVSAFYAPSVQLGTRLDT